MSLPPHTNGAVPVENQDMDTGNFPWSCPLPKAFSWMFVMVTSQSDQLTSPIPIEMTESFN